MVTTTIKIHGETKTELDRLRESRSESYDDIIRKVVYIARTCRKDPELSKETVLAIEAARERIRRGHYLTEAEAKRRLGLCK
jgi:hypothetical protein